MKVSIVKFLYLKWSYIVDVELSGGVDVCIVIVIIIKRDRVWKNML